VRAELHQIVTFATDPFHGNPVFVLTVPEEAGLGYLPDWKLLEKTALAVV